MTSWRRWRALSPPERRLLTRAACLLALAKVHLPFVAFRADSAPADAAGDPDARVAALAHAQAAARLLAIAAARLPLRTTCLHRSLALWWLLRRDGVACALRLGARAGDEPFAAHAWVECAGVALNEAPTDLEEFAAFNSAVVVVGSRARPAVSAAEST